MRRLLISLLTVLSLGVLTGCGETSDTFRIKLQAAGYDVKTENVKSIDSSYEANIEVAGCDVTIKSLENGGFEITKVGNATKDLAQALGIPGTIQNVPQRVLAPAIEKAKSTPVTKDLLGC